MQKVSAHLPKWLILHQIKSTFFYTNSKHCKMQRVKKTPVPGYKSILETVIWFLFLNENNCIKEK